jgi:hypothetical protein
VKLGEAAYWIGDVADPERNRDNIERSILEGELHHVRKLKVQPGLLARVRLAACLVEHWLGKISTNHSPLGADSGREEERKVSGSCGSVKDVHALAHFTCLYKSAAPKVVYSQGEYGVGEIVTGCDGSEHLLNGLRL